MHEASTVGPAAVTRVDPQGGHRLVARPQWGACGVRVPGRVLPSGSAAPAQRQHKWECFPRDIGRLPGKCPRKHKAAQTSGPSRMSPHARRAGSYFPFLALERAAAVRRSVAEVSWP
jgi:hypothetical protein